MGWVKWQCWDSVWSKSIVIINYTLMLKSNAQFNAVFANKHNNNNDSITLLTHLRIALTLR